MERKKTPEERIDRLNEVLDSMLHKDEISKGKRNNAILIHFGLTDEEAKAWLKREPNFPADEISHEPPNRRRLHRTQKQVLFHLRVTVFPVAYRVIEI